MIDITHLTLTQAAEAIRQMRISPIELTLSFLERIETKDPKINSFITVTSEAAIESAKKAEREIYGGEYFGPLHGIPLAIKDMLDISGVRTTAGSKIFENNVAQNDSTVVGKLKSAGAIILGKLNMHEWALGVTSDNPFFGTCRNPWDLDRIPGGSSGGSGSATAAQLCFGSIGTDTWGSIRVPASLCGVVGLKPTYGRVSLEGVVPLSWNHDHVGPIAREVSDVAILLQAISGYDKKDPHSINIPVVNFSAHLKDGIRDIRIAVADQGPFLDATEKVLDAVHTAIQVFKDLGAEIRSVEIPSALPSGVVTSDAAAFHQKRMAMNPNDFGSDVMSLLQAGAARKATDYAHALNQKKIILRHFEEFFEEFDILITATTPIVAPLIENLDVSKVSRDLNRFTALFNVIGFPALSIPCGFTEEGMPIGLQIVSGPWNESLILRTAYAFEQSTEWHLARPNI